MNYNEIELALRSIEEEKNISKEIIVNALKEALIKAYKKNEGIDDKGEFTINLRVDIDQVNGEMKMFRLFNVVDKILDYENEISLEEAKEINEKYEIGDVVEEEVSIDELSRSSTSVARNIMKQTIRQAEKDSVFAEYIDLKDEMVLGIVESVEKNFVLVNLGKTIAMMSYVQKIPNERYYEGQKIRVVINDVKKDTKGPQVMVSRADPLLVKRLFEKEVPEIYQGVVEIKAIAREAGDRTKMAVYSYNPDVDPIGACIGQRGQRVHDIIQELNGERIDIFEWSDDVVSLIKNALAPAEVISVVPLSDRNLLVVVNQDQLSLAIGKKGKNARLAVKLTDKKIDIKTPEQLEEEGINYLELEAQYNIQLEKDRKEAELRELEEIKLRKELEMEKARQLALEHAAARKEMERKALEEAEEEFDDIEEYEDISEEIDEEVVETKEEPKKEVTKENIKTIEENDSEKELSKENSMKHKLLETSKNNEYVSVFEKLIGDKDKPSTKSNTKKKKKKDEDDRKFRSSDIRKDLDYKIKPLYSEEELKEIEELEEEEELSYYDDYMDYSEYDDDEYYYDEEE